MYIKIVINYCCLFVLNSFDGCFVVSFSVQVLLLHSQTPLIVGVREWRRERKCCVCVSLCVGLRASWLCWEEKNISESLCAHRFIKVHLRIVADEVAVCAFVLISKAHTLTHNPSHAHIRINSVFIQTPFCSAWVSHSINSRIWIYFHFFTKSFGMPTTIKTKQVSRWKNSFKLKNANSENSCLSSFISQRRFSQFQIFLAGVVEQLKFFMNYNSFNKTKRNRMNGECWSA